MKIASLFIATALLSASAVCASVFVETFNFGVLDPNLTLYCSELMVGTLTTNGLLRFDSKTNYCSASVSTDFSAVGGFLASVVAHNGEGAALTGAGPHGRMQGLDLLRFF